MFSVRAITSVVVAAMLWAAAESLPATEWVQTINGLRHTPSLVSVDSSCTTERRFIVNHTTYSATRCVYTSGTTTPTSHKVLVYITFKSNFTNEPFFRYGTGEGYGSLFTTGYVPDEWCTITGIINGLVPGANSGILPFGDNYMEGEYLSFPLTDGIQAFDLTEMYGAGNEPTVEEFMQLLSGGSDPCATGIEQNASNTSAAARPLISVTPTVLKAGTPYVTVHTSSCGTYFIHLLGGETITRSTFCPEEQSDTFVIRTDYLQQGLYLLVFIADNGTTLTTKILVQP